MASWKAGAIMLTVLQTFWLDQAGVLVSAELVIVVTLCILALLVGLGEITSAIAAELSSISCGVETLNQSYQFSSSGGAFSFVAGSQYVPDRDADKDLRTHLVGTASGESGR